MWRERKTRHRALGALLFLLIGVSAVRAEKSKPVMRLSKLTGPIYLVEDEHYVTTNSLVYIGPEFVTVVGATWIPDTAKLLADQIRKLTSQPIREVIDTSPDPEWSGGNAYWKRIGAQIVAHQVTYDFSKVIGRHHGRIYAELARKDLPHTASAPVG